MALILCPQCGKKISDSAQACPHCGCACGEAKQEQARRYETLSLLERNALDKEFAAVDRCFIRYKHKSIALFVVGWLMLAVSLIGMVVALFVYKGSMSFTQEEYNEVVAQIQQHIDNRTADSADCKILVKRLDEMNAEREEKSKTMGTVVILLALPMVPAIVCLSIQKYGMTKERVLCVKKFQLWLKNQKGIEQTLYLTSREKKFAEGNTEDKKWL